MIWGDAGAPRTRRGAKAAVIAAAVVMLSAGCVSTVVEPAGEARPTVEAPVVAPAPASPTAEPAPASPTVIATQAFSGTGPGPVALDVPAGTQSVLVQLTCDPAERFTAELGDSMMLGQAPQSGSCDPDRVLAWPWEARSAPELTLGLAPEAEWAASVSYSSAPFPQDAALAEECELFSGVYSQVTNADEGYGFYAAFGADEWNRRVDAAADAADTLAASSTTTLAPYLRSIHTVLAERSPIPGGMTEVQEFWDAQNPIAGICAVNHSEVYVLAEFGG
ncbi:hypothetical protein [Microbacterium aquilitoris]|uniref:Septum formation-related domain-containing protein n=1 Tax=Microbacterium aquilitoris TaxID=3067307 RepID=A0ABU3GG21_9MICO|nr:MULTISPECIES: hypothetical protein [unclassified Microbacterium]MDT3329647.1 hypothetical protein [Microbacterium sp. KSW-18]MDT3345483.1 hypothetical protein [Microbacterium sp. KSW2-22]